MIDPPHDEETGRRKMVEPDPPHVREDYREVWLSGWRAALRGIEVVLDKWVPQHDGEQKSAAQRIDNEMSDYFEVMGEVSKVYDSVTMGRISKPNTGHQHVIEEVEELQQRAIDEAVKEAIEEFVDEPPVAIAEIQSEGSEGLQATSAGEPDWKKRSERFERALRNHLCEHDMADWVGCSFNHQAPRYCAVCEHDQPRDHQLLARAETAEATLLCLREALEVKIEGWRSWAATRQRKSWDRTDDVAEAVEACADELAALTRLPASEQTEKSDDLTRVDRQGLSDHGDLPRPTNGDK